MTRLLGIEFNDHLTLEEAAESILTSRKAFVVTPNVDHVVSYHESQDYRDSIQNATHVLCDSRVLSSLAKIFMKTSLRNVVTGSDLTKYLIENCSTRLGHVLVVGGKCGDADMLASHHDGLSVSQLIPPFGLKKDRKMRETLVEEVSAAKADTVLLAVGSPQQEMIATMLWECPANARLMCIGASVDFLTGRQLRAPAVFQRLSMEWLYRLFSDPKRLVKRYICRDMKIFLLIFASRNR